MEQGWLYIGEIYCTPDFYADGLPFETGSAIRMAQDLGLNRNADRWQYRGNDLFNSQEKQMRKQLWFACVMADEYSAVYMGQ
jgi:Fungal specific transcription factor domain